MMVSTPEEATESTTIKVFDEMGPFSIVGWEVAKLVWSYADAERQGYSRWTDVRLYGVADDKTMKYAIQITGRSSLYHHDGGPCREGVSVPVGKLVADKERYEFLEACRRCKPKDLNDLSNTDSVKLEVDLQKLYKCRNASEVVTTMYGHGKKDGQGPSGLSIRLLTTAALLDPDIEQALMNMPRT